MSANPNKVTVRANCEVFRAKGGFFLLDRLSDAPPIGPFKSRDRAENAAEAIPVSRFYDEIVRLEDEPQPAPNASDVFRKAVVRVS